MGAGGIYYKDDTLDFTASQSAAFQRNRKTETKLWDFI